MVSSCLKTNKHTNKNGKHKERKQKRKSTKPNHNKITPHTTGLVSCPSRFQNHLVNSKADTACESSSTPETILKQLPLISKFSDSLVSLHLISEQPLIQILQERSPAPSLADTFSAPCYVVMLVSLLRRHPPQLCLPALRSPSQS